MLEFLKSLYTNPILKTRREGVLRLTTSGDEFFDDAIQDTIDGFEDAANEFFLAKQLTVGEKTAIALAGIGTAATTGYLLIGLPQREIEESTIFESEVDIVLNDNFVGRNVQKFINSLEGKSFLCQIID